MKIKELLHNYISIYHDHPDKMEKLSEFIHEYFIEIKENHPEYYDDFEDELEEFTFIIDDKVIEEAIDNLVRRDGKLGKKWEHEDTTAVGKQYGIFTKHPDVTPMIWYFALNYTYAVHYKSDRTIADYVELTCEEIADKNICIEGKIKHLYNK